MTITDEMVEEAAKVICDWINYAWDGESDLEGRYPDWCYDGYEYKMLGGKPALRRVAKAALEAALARSEN